jgi:hypothetical protein
MFYAALVNDSNSIARARVLSAYVGGTPTVFIDGGYRNFMGGYPTGGPSLVPLYEPEIQAAAQRAVPALDLITAMDWLGDDQVRVHVALGNGVTANTAPPTPAILTGGGQVPPLQNLQFSLAATDPEDNMVYYQWDWGDGQISDWLGPYNSGASVLAEHSWTDYGDYNVTVKVRDPFGEESAWSAPAAVRVSCCVGRVGDANATGVYPDEVTLGDIMLMVDVLFISNDCTKLVCPEEADVNQSGGATPLQSACLDYVSLGDIMTLVDFLFITGPETAVLPECL